MEFLQYHPGLTYKPNPTCTIFNYDLYIFLLKDGPMLFDCSMGGYIDPKVGGHFNPPHWEDYISSLKELSPISIIIPECVVNGFYPDIKTMYETTIKDLGYSGDRLITYIQKEQKYYYHDINDSPDWFYKDPADYTNIIYHSIGYSTPSLEEDKDRFKQFKFCKQGFLCESFKKLYHLKDLTINEIFEKRLHNNYEYGKFVWYGNPGTSIREIIFKSLEDTDLFIEQAHYGEENLLDWVLSKNGIGLSIDGLVYNTIRDTELGMYGVPSFKITEADDYVAEQNNLDMFGSRSLLQIPIDDLNNYKLSAIAKSIKTRYEHYMDHEIFNYEKMYKQIRYHFFITLLQKYHNIEFYVYDILFGDKFKDFIDNLDIDVDLSILGTCAAPDVIDLNKTVSSDYIDNFHDKFVQHFKTLYSEWVKLNNTDDQNV